MEKATKDLPYNTTHNIRVEGQLVKRKVVKKPTLTDIMNAMNTGFSNVNKRIDNLENRFDHLENRFDKLESRFNNFEDRFDNIVAKNNLQE